DVRIIQQNQLKLVRLHLVSSFLIPLRAFKSRLVSSVLKSSGVIAVSSVFNILCQFWLIANVFSLSKVLPHSSMINWSNSICGGTSTTSTGGGGVWYCGAGAGACGVATGGSTSSSSSSGSSAGCSSGCSSSTS